jgi:hypothetical protein
VYQIISLYRYNASFASAKQFSYTVHATKPSMSHNLTGQEPMSITQSVDFYRFGLQQAHNNCGFVSGPKNVQVKKSGPAMTAHGSLDPISKKSSS